MENDAAIRKLIVLMNNVFGNVTIAMLTVSKQLAAQLFFFLNYLHKILLYMCDKQSNFVTIYKPQITSLFG